MAYTPPDGKGKAWTHDKQHPKQPDYTGICNWQGQRLRIAMWHNPPDQYNEQPTLSIALQDADEWRDARVAEAKEAAKGAGVEMTKAHAEAPAVEQLGFDDDIPF